VRILPFDKGEMSEGQRGWTLEGDEFEMAFVTHDNAENIESGYGMVISMNLELTEELIIE